MNNDFELKLKEMDMTELYSYYKITKNIGKVAKVLGVSTALLMISFFSLVTVLVGAPLLYFFSQTDVAVDQMQELIGIQILKLSGGK